MLGESDDDQNHETRATTGVMSPTAVALAWGNNSTNVQCNNWTSPQKRSALLKAPEITNAFGRSEGLGYMRACCLLYPHDTGMWGEKLAKALAVQPERNETGVIGLAMVLPAPLTPLECPPFWPCISLGYAT